MESLQRRHVVFLNWRDASHALGGGAELYCESLAAEFVRRGARVTLVTSRADGAARRENRRGFAILRRGGRLTVYPWALGWLLAHRGDVDAVVDCQNGIPFFAPLVAGRTTPVLSVVHHVHQRQFSLYFPAPVAAIGRWLESTGARLVYGRRPIVAVSPSTRRDVRRILGLRGDIYLVPNGMTEPPQAPLGAGRSPTPRIVVVGRLVAHKRIASLVEAMPALLSAFPDLRLDIVGSGPEQAPLRVLAEDLGVAGAVTLHGRVGDDVRDGLLAEAWMTVNPSAGEGWGLSVLEANAAGLPALAFDVAGLRDAIRDGDTGWLIQPGSDLAGAVAAALRELSDADAAQAWSRRTRDWARNFTWERSAARLESLVLAESARLEGAVAGGHQRRPAIDLACRMEAVATRENIEAIGRACRRTDVWTVKNGEIVAIFYGTDELGVDLALARTELTGPRRITVAHPSDLLIGMEAVEDRTA
jgi:glycosyltransferase involved in cell wall biosynthesis